VQHPAFPVGGYIQHPLHVDSAFSLEKCGPCEVQIVRSSADWSHGILPTEHSIQNAYIENIENARNFIYIENQFFITATGGMQKPVHNRIGRAIVNAVAKAHREGRDFRVLIVIPAIPGFPGDLRDDSATGTRAIIDYQYKSINRGRDSVFGQLRRQGVDPTKYVFVFNLRIYDRLHVTDALLQREQETGVGYGELQAAAAADALGSRGVAQDSSSGQLEAGESRMGQRRRLFEEVLQEAPAQDTIAKNALSSGKQVKDEHWDDGEEQEKQNIVQEELYVHAKVMIVDDETFIVGSANINDRSQLGDHDSELAAVVKHRPTVSGLRKHLWMEHLGLLRPQLVNADGDEPNARPPGDGANDSEVHPLVEDPMSNELWETWTGQATRNTEIYRELFRTDPDDNIRTWQDYDKFCRKEKVVGHLFEPERYGTKEVKEMLSEIKGHLVWMPLKFLEAQEMAEPGLQVNAWTESIFT